MGPVISGDFLMEMIRIMEEIRIIGNQNTRLFKAESIKGGFFKKMY